MNQLRAIAITHRSFPLETIGKFHIPVELRAERLQRIKAGLGISELLYLSTCNRVELVFSLPHYVCPGLTAQILQLVQPSLSSQEITAIARTAERYNGPETITHMLRVGSSLESLVIGEHEIITQLRKSYEEGHAMGLTGDHIRLLMKQCLKTAKEIFTHTDLSRKPVSVVSLAWQKFKEFAPNHDARIVLIGAGQIITNFTKFLFENDYRNIVVFNRTLQKGQLLTQSFGGQSFTLDQLSSYTDGFDVIVSCTGADHLIVTDELYATLIGNNKSEKLLIDLALPADIDPQINLHYNTTHVDMKTIQYMSAHNIQYRQQALEDCNPIIESGTKEFEKLFQERQIEMAMQKIPETIKEIKTTALGSVFAKDLENLDDNAREVLDKIMSYMEKKYISIPMKMAKEVLLNETSKN